MLIKQVCARVYVNDMDRAVDFYEKLFHEKCVSRFKYHEVNLELARIDNLLIICGSNESLKPFRDTNATFLVDSLKEYQDYLLEHGAAIIQNVKKVPTGFNMTIKHPDGAVIEYVEFDKSDKNGN